LLNVVPLSFVAIVRPEDHQIPRRKDETTLDFASRMELVSVWVLYLVAGLGTIHVIFFQNGFGASLGVLPCANLDIVCIRFFYTL
jgi:hypothetical protein